MKKHFVYLTIVFFCSLSYLSVGQQQSNVLKSLQEIQGLPVKERLQATADLITDAAITSSGDELYEYLEEGIQTAREESLTEELAQLLFDKGVYLVLKEAKTYEALTAYQEALDIFRRTGNDEMQVIIARFMGNIYKDRGRLKEALTYYLSALKEAEKIGDKTQQARSLGSIGLIYKNQEKYTTALEYFEKALTALDGQDDKQAVAITYNNMGTCESKLGNHGKALEFFNKALEMDKQNGDEYGVAYDHFAIAEVYSKQGKYNEALKNISTGTKLFQKFDDTASLLACRILQSQIYRGIGLNDKSLALLKIAADSAELLGMRPLLKQAYEETYKVYEELGATAQAYTYYKKYINIKDSIASLEVSASIDKLQNEYNAEKRAKEIDRLRIEAALNQAEIDQQKQLAIFTAFGIGLLLILLVVIYGRYRIKQQANEDLEAHQKIIEDSNEKMMGSIRYGSRIQNALVKASESLEIAFPDSFILLKPKDVVTGDFYWYVNRGDEQIIAAIDCTGHGVPGAFMTVFGYSLLNKIVNNDGVTEPSQILALLGIEVMNLFQTQEEDQVIQDGMDMALVKINQREKKLYFAGASRPMILQNAKGQQLIKGDRIGLGGTKLMERGKPFTTFTYEYEKGDAFYIFSDGYADQFGGTSNKKFMSKNFRSLLNDIQGLPMKEQEQRLETVIQEWMEEGGEKQTDDMIVIGVSLP